MCSVRSLRKRLVVLWVASKQEARRLNVFSSECRTNLPSQNPTSLVRKKSRMTQTTGIRELTVATGRCSRHRRVADVARTEAKCSVIVRAAGTGVRNSVGNSI